MTRLEANINVTGWLILVMIALVVIGWVGDKSGMIDALGLRPSLSPSPTPHAPKTLNRGKLK